MPRRPPLLKTNGHNRIHAPGCYEAALRKVCDQDTYESASVLNCPNLEQLAILQLAHAQRTAEMMDRRRGERLAVQSYQLPDGLPGAPFQRFPRRGPQRLFWVTPDDVITLRP